jgi:hypothetical protein
MFIPREIFRFESGSSETWLTANADGTLTDTRENSGWRCLHRGIEPDECVISPAEAIRRWPQHAEAIQAAAQDALPPLHAIPVIGVDGVCLRVYRGPRMRDTLAAQASAGPCCPAAQPGAHA